MKISESFFLMIAGGVVALSCNTSSPETSIDDLSPNARKYLSMQLGSGSQNSMASNFGPGNPVNESFQRLQNNASDFSSGRVAGDSASTPPSDSTIFTTPWIDCAQVTTLENDDGSTSTTYDYGSGCFNGDDNYRYFMMGKYSVTYKNTFLHEGPVFKEAYYYQSEMNNYGGRYEYGDHVEAWNSNGTSESSGESEYNTDENTYHGNYTFKSNYVYSSNGKQYAYKGNGKSSYTEKQFSVDINSYEYKTGDDYYKTEVIEPLVTRYDCNFGGIGIYDFCYYSVYVSGREFVRYKEGEKEGAFEVDYGDGTCDNIITIIENGITVDVDLGNREVFF